MKSIFLITLYLLALGISALPAEAKSSIEFATVEKVLDGDTIRLIDGKIIRYIGVDTPELASNECYSGEAKKKNEKLLKGKKVKLVRDQSDKDKYGRLLRYVWVDKMFVNKELVRIGAADVFPKSPDLKYQKTFQTAKDDAEKHDRGAWKRCQQSGHSYYLSTYSTASTYYCDTDPGWKLLSKKYLRKFSSEKGLQQTFPSYHLHRPCK